MKEEGNRERMENRQEIEEGRRKRWQNRQSVSKVGIETNDDCYAQ